MKHSLISTLAACAILLLNAPIFTHEHGARGYKKGKVVKMFDRTDANQDEQLDLTEFLAHAEPRFKFMGLNDDGCVTKDVRLTNKCVKNVAMSAKNAASNASWKKLRLSRA